MEEVRKALLFICLVKSVFSACVFPDVFKKSQWNDNRKGDVIFTTWEMKGWNFIVGGVNISEWEVVDNTRFEKADENDMDYGYLALRAHDTFEESGTTYYSFVCLKFSKLTDDTYKYYSLHDADSRAGGERVKLHTSDDLTRFDEICDTTYVYNQADYSILIKKGTVPKSTCPNPILGQFDYAIEYPNGTKGCDTDKDRWEGCKDNKVIELNYTACPDLVAYSAGGKLSCIDSTEYNDNKDTQILVYNLDDAANIDDVKTFKYSCIRVSEDGEEMSIAPSYCRSGQTPYNFPQENGEKIGQKITTKELSHCRIYPAPGDDEKSLSKEQIIGIAVGSAVGVLLILIIIIVVVCKCRK